MEKEVKDIIIIEVDEEFKESPHLYLVDLIGLDVGTTSAFCRKYSKHEIKMVVAKNTLLRKAFDTSNVDCEPLHDSLKGSTAVVFTQTANVPAKLLKGYQKEGIPILKAAYAEESTYIGTGKLAKPTALRSKNEVIAEIVALLQSPTRNVVSALQSGVNTTHGVLKALGERPE